MGVGRDGSDPRQPEVEGRYRVAQLLGPGEHEPAQAGVGVEADAPLEGQHRELRDGVYDPVGVAGGGAHQHDGVAGDGPAGGFHVGFEVLVHRDAHRFDAEVVGGLVEGRVGGHGQHHLRSGDALLLPGPVPIGFHRHQDAFGAAGGHRAADLGVGVHLAGGIGPQHFGRHRHDLGFVFDGAGPQVGVEGVALGVQGVNLVHKGDVAFIAVIDGSRNVALAPALLLVLVQGLHKLEDGLVGEPFFGEAVVGGGLVPVGLEGRFQLGQHPLVFPLHQPAEGRHPARGALDDSGDAGGDDRPQFGEQAHDIHSFLRSDLGCGLARIFHGKARW